MASNNRERVEKLLVYFARYIGTEGGDFMTWRKCGKICDANTFNMGWYRLNAMMAWRSAGI